MVVLEKTEGDRKSIVCEFENPLKSRVSLPEASQIVNATVSRYKLKSENTVNKSIMKKKL